MEDAAGTENDLAASITLMAKLLLSNSAEGLVPDDDAA